MRKPAYLYSMLSLPLLVAVILLGFAAAGPHAIAREADDAAHQFPASELGKLPYLYFSSNNLGESCLFRMRQEDATIEINGTRYIGFQFWSTGLVEWLFTTTPGDLEPSTWLLVNQQGKVVDRIEPTDVPIDRCARILARFPRASRVTRYVTQGEALETRGRYHLLQKVTNDNPAPYAICITSRSPDSYEAGRSGELLKRISKPLLRESTDVVIENLKELRRKEGVKAATDYLRHEFEVRMDDFENNSSLPEEYRSTARYGFNGLFTNAWYEGQIGGGRLDAGWASEVYGVMFELCLERGHFGRMSVATNLTGSLSSAGRFGKLAEVFESWEEGMRLGGYNIDPTTYPDLGPALDVLPQVRKRDIPYLAPFYLAEEKGIKTQSRSTRLNTNLVNCFDSYAYHLWYQGKWHESLEWMVWAQGWASDPETSGPGSPTKGYVWHGALSGIADNLAALGFREQALALHENALREKITGGYEGKYTVNHQMAALRLKRLMGQTLPEDSLEQIHAHIERAAGNLYEKKETVLSYRSQLAELLIYLGRVSEGEALLDKLAAQGSRSARIARLVHWIGIGRVQGVEAELLDLLKQSREVSRKMDEIRFYRLYADFLQQHGRLGEALWVRRELVRLCEAFDLFTHLPVEMAKLATLLNQMGSRNESLQLADSIHKLLAKNQIPDHMAREVLHILGEIDSGEMATEETATDGRIEFQPLQSVVIPLKDASWVSHITLTNPSGTEKSGTLQASGFPTKFQEVNQDSDIFATLGGQVGDAQLQVRIEPASYKLIELRASDTFTGHGKFSLFWTSADGEYRTESTILLEEAIGGATKAIIQAGAYQLNPFYGISVYHHYVDTESSEHSRPMRFVSSQEARIEVYAMDGTPIAIDSQGNGSLRDSGDELFIPGDDHGNLRLPLTNGNTSFRILIYPQKELPEDGLKLRIECSENSQWELYAEDHLMPAPAAD